MALGVVVAVLVGVGVFGRHMHRIEGRGRVEGRGVYLFFWLGLVV